MVTRIRHAEEPVYVWQFAGIGKAAGSWQDMPRVVAQDVEAAYFGQFAEHGGTAWRTWDYTFTSGNRSISMTFHFDSTQQHSRTHQIWRRIRRILVTDA